MHIACREAEFLLKLNHDSIVQCYDVMDNGKQMVLLMEYLRGGPLLDDLHHIAGESYTEQQASVIAAQVLPHTMSVSRPACTIHALMLLSDVPSVAKTELSRTIKMWSRANAKEIHLFTFHPVSQFGCALHVHDSSCTCAR